MVFVSPAGVMFYIELPPHLADAKVAEGPEREDVAEVLLRNLALEASTFNFKADTRDLASMATEAIKMMAIRRALADAKSFRAAEPQWEWGEAEEFHGDA